MIPLACLLLSLRKRYNLVAYGNFTNDQSANFLASARHRKTYHLALQLPPAVASSNFANHLGSLSRIQTP